MKTEIEQLRNTLFIWFAIFIGAAVVIFPFSTTIFQKIYSVLVPSNIKMLITNPLNVFFIQVQFTLFFAFLLSLPIFLYKIISYISPALYSSERKIIVRSLIPTTVLFILGTLFAYLLLIPLTLRVLNSYNQALSATVYFEIGQFITFALVAALVTGFAFTLPMIMKSLSSLNLVNRNAWIKNFKFSLIAIVTLSAIITPDGTGVTMILLSLPLITLYLIGCFISNVNEEVSLVRGI